MASITISSPGGGVNPSNIFLPYNNNGVFADSSLVQNSPFQITAIAPDGASNGLNIDNSNGSYYIGDIDGQHLGNYIQLTEDGNADLKAQNLNITIQQPDGEIKIINDAIISNIAGGSSGQHLKLTINATKYKIALLNA